MKTTSKPQAKAALRRLFDLALGPRQRLRTLMVLCVRIISCFQPLNRSAREEFVNPNVRSSPPLGIW